MSNVTCLTSGLYINLNLLPPAVSWPRSPPPPPVYRGGWGGEWREGGGVYIREARIAPGVYSVPAAPGPSGHQAWGHRQGGLGQGACTAKTNCRKFETNITRKGISGPQSQFPHSCVCERIYIPTMGLPFLLEEICGPILGIYKSLTDTSMWKLGLRPRNSQKRNI
jgi:hypothetical protein